MYDVIVVGARAAGSPAAMLLARKGYKVLLVDRASFPSDTLSTHQVQIKGGVLLKRWGLLDRVLASNCPPARQASLQMGAWKIQGKFASLEGVDGVVCPRRTILDKILVDAAVQAGAELREDLLVEDLLFEEGRVSGIRGRLKSFSGSDGQVSEAARLVVGADGKRSLVARLVKAEAYRELPVLTCAYYTYWEGLDLQGGEMLTHPGGAIGLWPTNDGLSVVYTAYPAAEFQAVRENIEARFWRSMQSIPGLAERLREGRQAERFYGTADLPSFYRKPFGAGWALAGDAGMTMDPITGQGIGDAFWDAQRLAEAVDAGFTGRKPIEEALGEYAQQRDADTQAMYEFTRQLASFAPPAVEQEVMFAALARKPEAAGQFFGALSGSVPLEEFFAPANLFRIMGVSGMGRVFMRKMVAPRTAAAKQPSVV